MCATRYPAREIAHTQLTGVAASQSLAEGINFILMLLGIGYVQHVQLVYIMYSRKACNSLWSEHNAPTVH
jgi:hypothetical protein